MTRQDILDSIGPAAWSGNIAAQADLFALLEDSDDDSLARFARLDDDDSWESNEDDF